VTLFSRFQDAAGLRAGPVIAVITLIALAWLAAFMIRTLYLMATGLFRLGDAHPLLPPAVTVLAVWCLAVKGLVAGGGSDGEPGALTVLLLIGGPMSLTALAAVEIGRIRQRYPGDFPFRNGPLAGRGTGAASSP
jgi:hypothetical protein